MYQHLKHKLSAGTLRSCGSCTKCCEGYLSLAINDMILQDISKKCIFLEHKSCKIYETRPQTCQRFFCLFIKDSTIPEWLRPELSGILLRKLKTEEEPYLNVISFEDKITKEVADWLFENYTKDIYPHIFMILNQNIFIFSKQEATKKLMSKEAEKLLEEYSYKVTDMIDISQFIKNSNFVT